MTWTPKCDLDVPVPAPTGDTRTHDQEIAVARQAIDGKKARPRTKEYGGPLGRWTLVSPPVTIALYKQVGVDILMSVFSCAS